MATTMKAAVVRAFGKPLTIEEAPVPTPGPGEVLVKVLACGVCHTDLHAADGDWPVKPTLPFVPGHEGAGIVAASGRGVTRVKEGDPRRRRVAARRMRRVRVLHHRLGDAVRRAARQRLQRGRRVRGVRDRIGRVRRPAPERSDFAAMAPILCAGVTTYKGIKETETRRGNGSRSPASAGSGTWPFSTPRRWGSTSPRSTSAKRSSRLRARSAPT
jgi:propanol-preferring alcohol dehydrogenase